MNFVPSKLECWPLIGRLIRSEPPAQREAQIPLPCPLQSMSQDHVECYRGLYAARVKLSEEFARKAFEERGDFDINKKHFEKAWKQVKYLYETRYGKNIMEYSASFIR